MKYYFLVLMALLQFSISARGEAVLDCRTKINELNKQVKAADARLQEKIFAEQMYSEIASDAKTSSRLSESLFVVSSVMLTGGVGIGGLSGVGGGTSAAPGFEALMTTMLGSSKIAAGAVLAAPVVLTVGAAVVGVSAEIGLADRIKSGEVKVEQLIGVNKDFNSAQKMLDQERREVNLDYSQFTDFLGVRDRAATHKLLSIAQQSREVEELRLKHFSIAREAVKNACQ